MNQPTTLDLTGGWEKIVNNTERHNARLRFEANLFRHKQKKKLGKMTELAIGAILSVALGFSGLLSPWIAGGVAVILVCAACFIAGRIWEGCRK